MVKVIDNFLPKDLFAEMQYKILSNEFPWYYNNGIVDAHQKNKYQFVHTFFNCDINFSDLHNEYYNFIEPCLHKLGVKSLKRVKANLNPKTIFHRNGGFHYDMKNVTTSIFYINTNNGWTKFKDGCKVECIENRMVVFDSNIEHAGFSCTNQKRKVVVNFNYGTN